MSSTAAQSLRKRLRTLQFAPRHGPTVHAARVDQLVRDLQGELYRSQRAETTLKRTLNADSWLATFLANALRPQSGLTSPLASLLLSLLPREDLPTVLQRASIAFLDGRTRADTWPASAVGVLNVLLTNPAYAQHLDPSRGILGPLPFFVERYENALAQGDELLARLLLQNAPGVFATVRARDYRNTAGRRFARRVLEAEAAREPRSLSLSQSALASGSSDDDDGDMTRRMLDELMRSDDDDDDSPPSSSSSPPSLRARTPPSQWPQNYGYDGYAELLEELGPDWEQNLTTDGSNVGRVCQDAKVWRDRHAPEHHRDAPTFVHWPDLGASVGAETAFGRTVAVLGDLEFRQQRLDPGYAVPFETHADATQFLRTERGAGVVQFAQPDGSVLERALPTEGAVMIAPGVRHRLVNRSTDEPWCFYTLYTPVVHGFEDESK